MSIESSVDPEKGTRKLPNRRASLAGSLLSFFGAILMILVLRWVVAEPYVIPSGSMIPSLLIHDHVLVNKFAFGLRIPFTKQWIIKFSYPKRGDVVVFRSLEEDSLYMIKRVIGLPGDIIRVDEKGRVVVNGIPLESHALEKPQLGGNKASFYNLTAEDIGGELNGFEFFEETLGDRTHLGMLISNSYRWSETEVEVPAGHIFVMGDNRDNSRDSRIWGTLPFENLLGRASLVWLSCTDTLVTAPFVCDPAKIRWRRFFHIIQ
ncbi:MAG: signal peptidase I [Bdellovibrionales bacterium]|nr:signal peptidase I [Bdellovibrionales bacterium]